MNIALPGSSAKKTARRLKIIDGIMKGLSSTDVFRVIGNSTSENAVKNYLHQAIQSELRAVHSSIDCNASPELADKRARRSLLWESDVNTTVNNIQFLGTQHRPDFVVLIEGIRIALEVKRGEKGQDVREALGQCLVYASQFEFTCCAFLDISCDKKVRRACEKGALEHDMLERLWQHFNVKMTVV